MNRATLRLVLLISCAHALVHVYELSLPSVEQNIGETYSVGKHTTGVLGSFWRIPWGFFALAAGWLVDRYGARRMLAIYLWGCSAACLLAGIALPLPWLFFSMFLMGACASIYHPAGLALITHETEIDAHPRALGLHGVFGSAGIGSAPLIAWLVLDAGGTWREYYWILALPGLLLGAIFMRHRAADSESQPVPPTDNREITDQHPARWSSFFTLTVMAMLIGLTYSGFLHFLPRYLAGATAHVQLDKFHAALVLFVGCAGQYLAGRWGRRRWLEVQMILIVLLNVPCLVFLALAEGNNRFWAAGSFTLVFFMTQPIYNSLIAKYTPSRRRSLSFGFSFAMGLGFGGLGPTLAGYSPSDRVTFLAMAAIALVAAAIGALLYVQDQRYRSQAE